jgi:hypothetical protein
MITHLYTARAKFSKNDDGDFSWSKYIEWSKLVHLTELVSLDTSLNEVLVEPDRNNEEDWKEIVIDDYHETGFFRSLDYVLSKTSMIPAP